MSTVGVNVSAGNPPSRAGGGQADGDLSGMTQYGISIVGDSALTLGFAFVALPDGGAWIYYRESALRAEVLEDSWAAYRQIVGLDDPEPAADAQRDPCQLRLVV